ncbi:hypothetical protein FXO37_25998 [Capsicum annuum]|nr:hypothetical protein FXO37_25998 [Capsicum annuum]
MAIFLILAAATFTTLIASTAAVVPPAESQIPALSSQQNENSVMYELEKAKIKIARLGYFLIPSSVITLAIEIIDLT